MPKCLTCDLPATTQGFCDGCYDDLCMGSDDAIMVAKKLVVIIQRQQQRIAELESAHERIDVLEYVCELGRSQLEAKDARITELEADLQENGKLKAQLTTVLATIDRATTTACQCYGVGCEICGEGNAPQS